MARSSSRATEYLLSSAFSALKLRTVRIPLSAWEARCLFWAWHSWVCSFSSWNKKREERAIPPVPYCWLCRPLSTPTLDKLMYLFCIIARSGISMQVSRVSSHDRPNMTLSMRKVFTVLRTITLVFSATVRPILSTSLCRREESFPVRGLIKRLNYGATF